MKDKQTPALEQEWLLLQSACEQYEKLALAIKTSALLVLCSFYLGEKVGKTLTLLLLCHWVAEAMYKTFQQRLLSRLQVLEQALAANTHTAPMQLNSQWLSTRPSTVGLLLEYAKHGCKPTVAFPHIVFVTLSLYWLV